VVLALGKERWWRQEGAAHVGQSLIEEVTEMDEEKR
jgi:hypothetical protein